MPSMALMSFIHCVDNAAEREKGMSVYVTITRLKLDFATARRVLTYVNVNIYQLQQILCLYHMTIRQKWEFIYT